MATRRWQRASWFAIALTSIGIALFARLGVWQLERARQAQALLDAFAGAARAPAEALAGVAANPPAGRYPHVRVRGRFVAGRAWLRDEQVHDGRLGVDAYAAFEAAGQAALLLVDRGWVAWSHAPGSQPALPPLSQDEVELAGLYAPFPGSGLRVGGDALAGQKAWPKLTLAIDRDEIAADLGRPLLPRVLLLDPDPASGFVRSWTPNLMPPARHRAYAFQWFAFAVAALALFVWWHWKKVER
jgi:surfeit locus 1 family protein